MRCISPRNVGFLRDGKTLAWNLKKRSPEYPIFQLPCGKCIECRLDYGRQWAVRCTHEAQMHPSNAFITTTYSDENLKSPKLVYEDWQLFMKKLRNLQNDPMGMFVTGEYGEKNKRPHWHAIIFNWYPRDAEYSRSNERGDKIYHSDLLSRTWGLGHCELGSVTFESAGYCARYAAKKLVHGKDDDHEYHPISKKSSKNAIGKKWLETYWSDVFSYGKCLIRNKDEIIETSIPRYYEKWLEKHNFSEYLRYVTEVKYPKMLKAETKQTAEQSDWVARHLAKPFRRVLTPNEIRKIIIEEKFNQLQSRLKL